MTARLQIGDLGIFSDLEGIAFAEDGTLYGSGVMPPDRAQGLGDPETGAATLVGFFGLAGLDEISDLAFHPETDTLYGIGDVLGRLYEVDRTTGAATPIGAGTGLAIESNQGLDIDAAGTIWGISDNTGLIYTVDPDTGVGTAVTIADITEAENLAIGPPRCANFKDGFEFDP